MYKLNSLLLCCLFFGLSGCAYINKNTIYNRSNDYLLQKNYPALKIPSDFNAHTRSNTLIIPSLGSTEQQRKLSTHFTVPHPRFTLVTNNANQQYHLIDHTKKTSITITNPDKIPSVLNQVRKYCKENKIVIADSVSIPNSITTKWHTAHDTQGVISRIINRLFNRTKQSFQAYRFQFKVYKQNNLAHIDIFYQGTTRRTTDNNKKFMATTLNTSSLNISQTFATDLLIYLAKDKTQPSYLSLPSHTKPLDIALTEEGSGNPILMIHNASYERSWVAVGTALKAANIKTVDKNRATGIYYLAGKAPENKSTTQDASFLHTLFTTKKKVKSSKPSGLHVRVSQFTSSTQVSIEKNIDHSADKAVSKELLIQIQHYLK